MNSQRKYYKKLCEDKIERRNDTYYRDENYYRDATYFHEHEKRCDSEMVDENCNYRGESNHPRQHRYGEPSHRTPQRVVNSRRGTYTSNCDEGSFEYTFSDYAKHVSKIANSSCFQDSCGTFHGHKHIDDDNCSRAVVHSPPQLRRHRVRNHGEELRSPLETVDNTYEGRDSERSVQNYPIQARQHRRRLALNLLDEISNIPLRMAHYETIGPASLNIHRFRLPDEFHPYLDERKCYLSPLCMTVQNIHYFLTLFFNSCESRSKM